MPVVNLRSRPGRVIIPDDNIFTVTQNVLAKKVEAYIDGTLTDISEVVFNISITKNSDSRCWSARFSIANTDSYYTNKLANDTIVKISYNFSDGTTQQFEGTLQSYEYDMSISGRIINCECFDYSYPWNKKTIWKTYTEEVTGDQVIRDLINDNTTGFTFDNVDNVVDTLIPQFVGKSLTDCIREVAEYCKCNFFLAGTTFKDVYFFKKVYDTSRRNEKESIAYAINLRNIRHKKDHTPVITKIYAKGGEIDGLANMVVVGSGAYEGFFTDNTVYTQAALKIAATRYLNNIKEEQSSGTGSCVGLIEQLPGYHTTITSAREGVSGWKRIMSFTTSMTNGLITSFTFDTRKYDLSEHLISIEEARKRSEQNKSPEGFYHSEVWNFDASSDIDSTLSTNVAITTDTNSEATELAVITGSTGTWISNERTIPAGFNSCTIRTNADYRTSACTFYAAFTRDMLWQEINLKEVNTILATGTKLRLKSILINDANDRIPQFDAISIELK